MKFRIIAFLVISIPIAALAAGSVALTLPEAVRLAIAQNRTIKLARLKVQEKEQNKAGAKADYFPTLKNQSTFAHVTSVQNVDIPRGAFGVFETSGPVPTHDIVIGQGGLTAETVGTTLAQPLTPLIRIRQENRVAASQTAASREDVRKIENQVAVKVHEAYYGILAAQLQRRAAEQELAHATTLLTEAQSGVRDGSALNLDVLDGKAGELQSEQSLLTIDLRLADLNAELDDLLGLPLSTRLILSPAPVNTNAALSREELLKIAFAANPEIASAVQAVEQAKAAVVAAKSAYLPDIAVFARHSYQNGIPFLVRNFGTFGIAMNYDVFDFGKRRAAVREREAQLAQAQLNVERLKEEIAVEIERSANKEERTRRMLEVAAEVVRLRLESERVAENQLKEGVVLISTRRAASAASYKAQADMLQAQLAYMLAQADLQQVLGRTPAE